MHNCFVFVQDGEDKSHYQMHYEQLTPKGNYALAFVPNNTNDKYYIIPQWQGDTAMLTIHKNPHDKYLYVFALPPSSRGTVIP